MEVIYWLITRIILTFQYNKIFGGITRPIYFSILAQITHAVATIFPCEMLIFFGYHKKQSNDYEKSLLNLSWLRRIVSLLRLIIMIAVQVLAHNVNISDDFISMVYLFQTVYLAMLMVAVCPQPSTYDN